jgi:hypothetical protein
MTTATPVRSNGAWGNVIAVVYNGETITPETPGAYIQEDRQTTYEKEGCYPETITNRVTFNAIRPWEVLEAAGLLPDLTPIPEPLESVKQRAYAEVDFWWDNKARQGIDVGNGVILRADSNDATQLRIYLSELSPSDTPMFSDINGIPHFVPIESVTALAEIYKNEFTARRTMWAIAKTQIQSAQDTAAIETILQSLT